MAKSHILSSSAGGRSEGRKNGKYGWFQYIGVLDKGAGDISQIDKIRTSKNLPEMLSILLGLYWGVIHSPERISELHKLLSLFNFGEKLNPLNCSLGWNFGYFHANILLNIL